jgi:multidrug resistance efflux pump
MEKRTLDDRAKGLDRRLEQTRANGAVWKEERDHAMTNVKAAQSSEALARQSGNDLQR